MYWIADMLRLGLVWQECVVTGDMLDCGLPQVTVIGVPRASLANGNDRILVGKDQDTS